MAVEICFLANQLHSHETLLHVYIQCFSFVHCKTTKMPVYKKFTFVKFYNMWDAYVLICALHTACVLHTACILIVASL